MIRYPRPLSDGDLVGVAAPSAGVPAPLQERLAVAVRTLRERGLEVRIGDLVLGGGGAVAAGSPDERAAELMAMMTDPLVRAVVPPWGGEIALDLLDRLDWAALGADPTWLVGYSDISTVLLPLTLLTGVATVHGQNLMDTPYRVPAPLASWPQVLRTPPGGTIEQGAAERYRSGRFVDYAEAPEDDEYLLDAPGGWTRVLAPGDVDVTGRLVGGCLETVAHLAGTPYGDLDRFVTEHAPEGLIVYLEAAEVSSVDVARRLLGLRYAGWFRHARAVLIGRTDAPGVPGFSQHDAVRHALAGLDVPVLVDVDCGHVAPQLVLVNGALARLRHDAQGSTLTQTLV